MVGSKELYSNTFHATHAWSTWFSWVCALVEPSSGRTLGNLKFCYLSYDFQSRGKALVIFKLLELNTNKLNVHRALMEFLAFDKLNY